MYIRSKCREHHLLCHLGASHNTGQVTSLVRREIAHQGFFQLSPFNRRFSVTWMTRMGDGWLVTNRRGFVRMDGWVDQCLDEWMDGCMGGWMNRKVGRCSLGWLDEYKCGWLLAWMDKWIDRYVDGYSHGWVDVWVG